tara:strand:- start:459 stop:1397 length:939 start_codon:yes stop_codon:yes gene_type:complete
MINWKSLSLPKIARLFGADIEDFNDECIDLLKQTDFSYYILEKTEREQAILQAVRAIDSDTQRVSDPGRKQVWEKGWAENLKAFRDLSGSLPSLMPKYIRASNIVRLDGNYVYSSNRYFERDFIHLFELWLFRKYMSNFSQIYEFGCGSGFKLIKLAKMFPDSQLIGLDFVPSSISLIEEISKYHKLKMKASLFDLTDPDYKFDIAKNSCIFTYGTINQLGNRFESFIEYLIDKSVDLCVHVEPLVELYDTSKLFDYLAKEFQTQRHYLANFLPYLIKLQEESKIDLLNFKRLGFGNINWECFNYVVWKPKI